MFEVQIPIWLIYSIIFISLFISIFYLIIFIQTRKTQEIVTTKKFPYVTFIIPAFNAEQFIEKTINSVFNVDYPKNKIKIIVVNDGSTDNTAKVVRELAKRYRRINLLNKKNEGKAKALNYGIARCKTEFVAVLDADTMLQPDLLKKAFALFDKKTMAVTCRIMPINKNKFIEKIQFVEYTLTSFFRKLLSNIEALPIAPAFTIYRRNFFLRYGGFDTGNLTEDFEMALRVYSKHYKIRYILDSYVSTIVPNNFKQLLRQRVRWGYGTLYNLKKYKQLFSKSYGELGLFALPMIAFGIVVLLLLFFISLLSFSSSLFRTIYLLRLGWVPSFSVNTFRFIIFLSDPRIILGLLGFGLSLFFLFLIKKETQARINIFLYVLYILIYIFLLAFFQLISLIRFLTKKPSW